VTAKLYTKTGDEGLTGLLSGERVSKASPLIDLYGDVDDLNSQIGLSISFSKKSNKVTDFLEKIQHKLFDIGSLLACSADRRDVFKLSQIEVDDVEKIEAAIDDLEKDLPPLKNFILPGGGVASSSVHLCRTKCRNLERKLVLSKDNGEILPDNILKFTNRLSDYLFVASRWVNQNEGKRDVKWESGISL